MKKRKTLDPRALYQREKQLSERRNGRRLLGIMAEAKRLLEASESSAGTRLGGTRYRRDGSRRGEQRRSA